MASCDILTLEDYYNIHKNVLCDSALAFFLSENKDALKKSITKIDDNINILNENVINNYKRMIHSPFIFDKPKHTNSEYTLLQAQVVLDFCRQLTLTEEFVQSDKDALIHIALVQMSRTVSEFDYTCHDLTKLS